MKNRLITYDYQRNVHREYMHGDLDVIKVLEKINFDNEYCELFNISMYKNIEEFCNFDYEWDDYGFRKTPIKAPSLDNDKNEVWCFGCSFTAGTGISSSYVWPTLLQEYTSKTVVNFGVGGAGPETVLRLLCNWIQSCKHNPANVLIYGFFPGRCEFTNKEGLIFPFVSGEYHSILKKFPYLKTELDGKLLHNERLYSRWETEIKKVLDNYKIDYTWIDIEENRLWRYEDPSWGRDLVTFAPDLSIRDIMLTGIEKRLPKSKFEEIMRCHPGPKHNRIIAEQFSKYI